MLSQTQKSLLTERLDMYLISTVRIYLEVNRLQANDYSLEIFIISIAC